MWIVCCSLIVARYVLFVVCCLLAVGCYVLVVVPCSVSLWVVVCLGVCWLLIAV